MLGLLPFKVEQQRVVFHLLFQGIVVYVEFRDGMVTRTMPHTLRDVIDVHTGITKIGGKGMAAPGTRRPYFPMKHILTDLDD